MFCWRVLSKVDSDVFGVELAVYCCRQGSFLNQTPSYTDLESYKICAISFKYLYSCEDKRWPILLLRTGFPDVCPILHRIYLISQSLDHLRD